MFSVRCVRLCDGLQFQFFVPFYLEPGALLTLDGVDFMSFSCLPYFFEFLEDEQCEK